MAFSWGMCIKREKANLIVRMRHFEKCGDLHNAKECKRRLEQIDKSKK